VPLLISLVGVEGGTEFRKSEESYWDSAEMTYEGSRIKKVMGGEGGFPQRELFYFQLGIIY